MSQCSVAPLPDRAVLRVTGPAARGFLQGLITNNVDKVRDGKSIHAGLLTPQGKILFDFFVVATGDGFLLETAKAKASELAQRLGFYKLRAEVEIAEDPSFTVAASWGEPPELPKGVVAFADPRLPELGLRLLIPSDASASDTSVSDASVSGLGCAVVTEDDYHARRIELGVPEGGRDYAFGDAFPHEALFDRLAGVDFTKGCFIGQEVVSRMEHRGTARKRIVGVEGEGPLPAIGAEITAGDSLIGRLGSVSGASGLALLRLDRAEEAKARGDRLRAGDIAIALRIPAWARFTTVPVAP